MADKKSLAQADSEPVNAYWAASQKNWRAWGSWFSWGSPVGLGLIFIEVAFAIWILRQAF